KKDSSATPGSTKSSSRKSTLTPRTRSTPRGKNGDDVAEEVVEGGGGAEEEEEEAKARSSVKPTDKQTDPFDAPSSSGDELSKDQRQVPRPTLKAKAKSRRPKI